MGDDDRIMLKNPNTGRDDVSIQRNIFEPVRDAILGALAELETVRFSELSEQVEARTPSEMWAESSVGWYTTSVKLHLEATGAIVREGSPQVLRLADRPG